MKVFIIAAITADGFIGLDDNHLADWTSSEDKKLFVELTKEAGVMVMGRKTFETIGKPLPNRKNIVYSSEAANIEGVEFTNEAPAQLIERLKQDGYEQLAVCGGQSIYDLFIGADLVDEIYLTIEPVVFGRGINLFKNSKNLSLSLIDHKKINDDTLFVKYKVLK